MQICAPGFRGDAVVARPIGSETLGDVDDTRRDLQLWVDERGFRGTITAVSVFADVDQAARDFLSSNLDGFAG
ncbi:hypothetical protein D9M69_459900 [compost metagenome]